jgi:hypothetical protein
MASSLLGLHRFEPLGRPDVEVAPVCDGCLLGVMAILERVRALLPRGMGPIATTPGGSPFRTEKRQPALRWIRYRPSVPVQAHILFRLLARAL